MPYSRGMSTLAVLKLSAGAAEDSINHGSMVFAASW